MTHTTTPTVRATARRCFRRQFWFAYFLLAFLLVLTISSVYAEAEKSNDDESGESSSSSSNTTTNSPPNARRPTATNEEDADWGSFYDPNNVFCGEFDCYKILGFNYETWGSKPPSLRDITKGYRGLSRLWHPDKNKAKGAREKFVAIAKAYEILTNSEKRAEYDYLRDRHDEYFKKYGSSILWTYAPQSDASFIIILFLIAGSAFTYYAQKNKWQTIANHLVKAATEDLIPREGGSTESIEIREKALTILAERKKQAEEDGDKKDMSDNVSDKKKKDKGPKLTQREKREKGWNELRPICVELVNKIDDFGAGFRKPTLQDLLVIRMVKWPYYLAKSTLWWTKYAIRRLRKLELNDMEREVLTKNAVGKVAWVAVSEEERLEMLTLELWVTDNLVEWREEHEMKMAGLSANRRKQIKKMRKRVSADDQVDDFKVD